MRPIRDLQGRTYLSKASLGKFPRGLKSVLGDRGGGRFQSLIGRKCSINIKFYVQKNRGSYFSTITEGSNTS